MHTFRVRAFTRAALAAIVALSLGACDDDPFDLEEDHEEAHGVVITNLDGDVIAESDEGQAWVFAGDEDALTVAAGETRQVRIWFVDADGDRFQIHDDDEHSVQVDVANTAIATWTDSGEQGTVTGIAEGSTTAKIELMHGDHPDFTASLLPLSVVAP